MLYFILYKYDLEVHAENSPSSDPSHENLGSTNCCISYAINKLRKHYLRDNIFTYSPSIITFIERENLATDKYSIYKGVSWSKSAKKWRCQISYGGKFYYLGLFDDDYEATMIYKAKYMELRGRKE